MPMVYPLWALRMEPSENMTLDFYNQEVAVAYKLLGTLYLNGPEETLLQKIIEEFELEIIDTSEEIEEDFTQLFVDPTTAILPYESLYNYSSLEEKGLWTSTTREVEEFYTRAGLVLNEDVLDIPPDHLGLEFLFVSYLLENNMIDPLRLFFDRHIVKWVPQYCDMLQQAAKTAFYRTVAELTKEVVTVDYEELNGG